MIAENVTVELGRLDPDELRGSLDGPTARSRLESIFDRVSHKVATAPSEVRQKLALEYAFLHSSQSPSEVTSSGDFWEVRSTDPDSRVQRVWLVPAEPSARHYRSDDGQPSAQIVVVPTADGVPSGDLLIEPVPLPYASVEFRDVLELPLAVAYSTFVDEYEMTIVGLPEVRDAVGRALDAFGLEHQRLYDLHRRIGASETRM